jgi:hypothetical protein
MPLDKDFATLTPSSTFIWGFTQQGRRGMNPFRIADRCGALSQKITYKVDDHAAQRIQEKMRTEFF